MESSDAMRARSALPRSRRPTCVIGVLGLSVLARSMIEACDEVTPHVRPAEVGVCVEVQDAVSGEAPQRCLETP